MENIVTGVIFVIMAYLVSFALGMLEGLGFAPFTTTRTLIGVLFYIGLVLAMLGLFQALRQAVAKK